MNLPPLSSHAAKSVAAVEAENFIHPTTLKTDALHELIRPEVIEPDFTASTSAWILRGGLIALLKDLLLQVTLGRYSIFTATRFEHVAALSVGLLSRWTTFPSVLLMGVNGRTRDHPSIELKRPRSFYLLDIPLNNAAVEVHVVAEIFEKVHSEQSLVLRTSAARQDRGP